MKPLWRNVWPSFVLLSRLQNLRLSFFPFSVALWNKKSYGFSLFNWLSSICNWSARWGTTHTSPFSHWKSYPFLPTWRIWRFWFVSSTQMAVCTENFLVLTVPFSHPPYIIPTPSHPASSCLQITSQPCMQVISQKEKWRLPAEGLPQG